MKAEILGTGCAKCNTLEKHVRQAMEELEIEGDLVKVTDINDIMKYNVMMTPALVINGEVKVSGRVPSVRAIKELLK